MRKCMLLMCFCIFMSSCCNMRSGKDGRISKIPVVECELVRVDDAYFEDTVKYKKYMNYERRLFLYLRLTNNSDQKAYIPINSSDSICNSEICVLLNDRLVDYNMLLFTERSDSFPNNTLLQKKYILIMMALYGDDFDDAGFSEFARPQKIVQQLRLVYDKSQSDTSLVHLPIADIEFKLAKDILYTYRSDTIQPAVCRLWIL